MSSNRRGARPAILRAAWRLLEKRGAGISLEQVARAARVSRQAVYLHFDNRNDLLVAVTDYANERTGFVRLDAHVEAARTPRRLLGVLSRAMAAFHPATAGASLAVEALCREDRAFSAAWNARLSGRFSTARRIAERLALAGLLLVPSVARAADVIWALTGPSLYDQLVVRRGWGSRAYERTLAMLLMSALVRSPFLDRPLDRRPRVSAARRSSRRAGN